jgi:type VI secretion system secreted protein VgrG
VLGAALATFAVLAATTVTNVGFTTVGFTGTTPNDLIGVYPGTAITGFPPGTDASGTNAIYAAGFNTATGPPSAAQAALTVAYNNIVATPPTVTFVGTPDLSTTSSGLSNCGANGSLSCQPGILGAGVYKASTTASIATRNLTLDGGGNPQSVFIFQIGTALTTTLNGGTSGNVLLINGANACNIYWAEGSAATLGGATFNGNVLTGPTNTGTESITINATTFNGRALAKTAVSIPVAGGSTITTPGGN